MHNIPYENSFLGGVVRPWQKLVKLSQYFVIMSLRSIKKSTKFTTLGMGNIITEKWGLHT